MGDDILDLIDNAIGDVTSRDAMRWSPDTAAREAEVGRMLQDIGARIMATWQPIAAALTEALDDIVRHLRPTMPVIEQVLRHQRRMDMWRRKTRAATFITAHTRRSTRWIPTDPWK